MAELLSIREIIEEIVARKSFEDQPLLMTVENQPMKKPPKKAEAPKKGTRRADKRA
jgi:hypothetical protein